MNSKILKLVIFIGILLVSSFKVYAQSLIYQNITIDNLKESLFN